MEDNILVHIDRYDQLIQKELVADFFLKMLRESAGNSDSLFISSIEVPVIAKFLGCV